MPLYQTENTPLTAFLQKLHARFAPLDAGRLADYIPELTRANPDWFGICFADCAGNVWEVGDTSVPFTIQSASKPFTYGLALDMWGPEKVFDRVGVEPTGDSFNAIVLEKHGQRAFNPMVNAGAIAVTDLIPGRDMAERLHQLLDCFGSYTGHKVQVDAPTFASEKATGFRNRAIAQLLRGANRVGPQFDESLDLYFQQCSVLVTCRDLALMAATLANGGIHPITGVRAITTDSVRPVLSVMYTCGMYDSAGEWAFRVGLPAKSGVSGGIFAVVPGQGAIAVFSPRVDDHGTSVRGVRVCQSVSREYDLHLFDERRNAGALRTAMQTEGRKTTGA